MKINTIYCADCLDLMTEIEDESIDMILCDLPYGTTQCKWDTIIPFEPLWEQYERIIKKNGAIVLTACQPFTSSLIMSNIKIFKYCWFWKKNSCGFLNSKKMPLKNVEEICVFYSKLPVYNPMFLTRINKKRTNGKSKQIKTQKGISTHNGGRLTGDFVQEFTNYPTQLLKFNNDNGLHPTQKPVALFEYLIKTYTNEGDLVLDNCIGSGTTAVACINTKRDFIGIEKDKDYFKIAQNRIKEAQGQTGLFK